VDPKYLSVRATAAWAALSAVLMIVGAFGPWASFFIFTVNGTDANAGITVLVCALIVGAFLALGWFTVWRAWTLVVSIFVSLIAAADAIYNTVDVERLINEQDLQGVVSIGWGLWAAAIGSVSCILGLFALMRATHRERMAAKRAVA
jgi:hypothetical protein